MPIGCHRQNATLTEQPATPVVAERHPAETAAGYPWDLIVPGKALVQERVVGPQQLQDARVLAQLALDEELCFSLERFAKIFVEFGKQVRIRRHAAHIAQHQPLSEEIRDQRLRAAVGQHPADLVLQHSGFLQFPL